MADGGTKRETRAMRKSELANPGGRCLVCWLQTAGNGQRHGSSA